MNTKQTVYAAIYARTASTTEMNSSSSLQSQISRCSAHCKENGFEIMQVFQEQSGGNTTDRNGLRALKIWLEANKSKNVVIVCDDLPRLARDLELYHEFEDYILAAGAQISIPGGRFNNSDRGDLMNEILANFDTFQRASQAEGVKRRMRAKLVEGHWCLAVPIGYKSDGKGRVIIQDGMIGSVVKEALEGYATGRFQNLTAVKNFIASHPEYLAVRKGRVSSALVQKMLSNVIYAGWIEYEPWQVERRPALHEPLISMDTFEAIQRRL